MRSPCQFLLRLVQIVNLCLKRVITPYLPWHQNLSKYYRLQPTLLFRSTGFYYWHRPFLRCSLVWKSDNGCLSYFDNSECCFVRRCSFALKETTSGQNPGPYGSSEWKVQLFMILKGGLISPVQTVRMYFAFGACRFTKDSTSSGVLPGRAPEPLVLSLR